MKQQMRWKMRENECNKTKTKVKKTANIALRTSY